DTDFVALGHVKHWCLTHEPHDQGYGLGTVMIPSRRAANKDAVTRSAVVPGLRVLRTARSQASNSAYAAAEPGARGQPALSTSSAWRLASLASCQPRLRKIRLSVCWASKLSWQKMIACSMICNRSMPSFNAATPSISTSWK